MGDPGVPQFAAVTLKGSVCGLQDALVAAETAFRGSAPTPSPVTSRASTREDAANEFLFVFIASVGLYLHQRAVADGYHPPRVRGHLWVVRDYHERLSELLVELLHQSHHHLGVPRVEVPRWLVGEDDLRVVREGAGDR